MSEAANRESEFSVSRLLVALDASASSLESLEAAASLAAGLEAELLGLFVEDESLVRLAELPCTGTISPFSPNVRRLDAPEVERRMHRRAARAERALAAAADRARVRHSFRKVSGSGSSDVLPEAEEDDLVLLRSSRGGTALETPPSTLILHGRWDPSAPVTVLHDGSAPARRALELAAALARAGSSRLLMLMPASARSIPGSAFVQEGIEARYVESSSAAALAGAGGEGLLVLPVEFLPAGSLSRLLGRLSRPVLLIR
jgi:nucleotide-binding universal stress UspA family protein